MKNKNIENIMEAMRLHPNVSAVQEKGCGALWNLSVNADNKVSIAKAGGVRSIMEAMRLHPNVSAVQKNGCGALSANPKKMEMARS